ncbi:MAG: type II toxin-antitoxin system Phd/YefM family antitoxin [Mogibacterium sp.]|nr:type II toxin-antitoxin system Phd/YefM family antitoxin [Mogibacterium sp.]
MTVAKQVDVRANIKKYFDMACNGRAVMIPRKENKNVVILSEEEFHELEKAKRNAEYLAKIDLANEQIRTGQIVVKTMEELETMAE